MAARLRLDLRPGPHLLRRLPGGRRAQPALCRPPAACTGPGLSFLRATVAQVVKLFVTDWPQTPGIAGILLAGIHFGGPPPARVGGCPRPSLSGAQPSLTLA